MQRAGSFEKTLMLGKIEGRRRRGKGGWDGWVASPTQWTWVWVNSRSWWWTGRPGVQFTGSQRVRHDWATELNWRVLCFLICHPYSSMESGWQNSSSIKLKHIWLLHPARESEKQYVKYLSFVLSLCKWRMRICCQGLLVPSKPRGLKA